MLFRCITTTILFLFNLLLYGQINLSGKTGYTQQKEIEGYIEFSNRLFEKTDSNGSPINVAGGDTATLFNTDRRMYIWGHYLIDVVVARFSNESGYIKTDTLECTFYDLNKWNYIGFDRLSREAGIVRKGRMTDTGSFFSKAAQLDPFYSIPDSNWVASEVILDEKRMSVINFIPHGGEYDEYTSRARVWVDMDIRNFPLQLSYILSAKMGNGFVCKMQFAVPESTAVMVTSLKYQQAKLDDMLIGIFSAWSGRSD